MNIGIRKSFPVARIPSAYEIAKVFFRHNCIQPLRRTPFLPQSMCLYVTYLCNFRCRMCGIWKLDARDRGEELFLEELDQILSDRLFSNLEFVNINGGEPNLRKDLVEIVELLIQKFPRLHTITMNSNGVPPQKTAENVEKISMLCRSRSIRFSVSLSLHGVGDQHDLIVGVKGAYAKVDDAFERLKESSRNYGTYLSANCVITSLNLARLDEVIEWGRRKDIAVNLTLGEIRDRFNNADMAQNVACPDKDRLIRFFRNLAARKETYLQHALRYKHLADMVEFGKRRTLACHYEMGGVILGSDGRLYYCKSSKAIGNCRDRSPYSIYFDRENLSYRQKELLSDKCLRCPPNTFNRMEVEKDLLKTIRFFFLSK